MLACYNVPGEIKILKVWKLTTIFCSFRPVTVKVPPSEILKIDILDSNTATIPFHVLIKVKTNSFVLKRVF